MMAAYEMRWPVMCEDLSPAAVTPDRSPLGSVVVEPVGDRSLISPEDRASSPDVTPAVAADCPSSSAVVAAQLTAAAAAAACLRGATSNDDSLLLAGVQCRLETKDLWDKFYELGTEMIITKSGRSLTLYFICVASTSSSHSPPGRAPSVVMSMSVCLSACITHKPPHRLTSPIFEVRSSSGGVAIRTVLPVLWMTSCFHSGFVVRHVYS